MDGWSSVMMFTKGNVQTVPNITINYKLFDHFMNPIYLGTATQGRHRLMSYYEKDDFNAHPTKRTLRGRIGYFMWKPAKSKAQALRYDRKFKYAFDFR